MCDTATHPEWVTGTDAVTRTDGPASTGSSYDEVNPILGPWKGPTYDEVNPILGPWKANTHWRVVEHEAPQRTVHRTSDIPLSRELEVAGEGEASEVTITLRDEAAFGPLG